MKRVLAASALVAAAACGSTAVDRLRGSDEGAAREAILELVARRALGELLPLRDDPDPLVRRRAKTAIGRITGQWGSDGRLVWTRSVAGATGQGKPIAVLHLFGELDQEFC